MKKDIGKKVVVFHNKYRYIGVLTEEDELTYRIRDRQDDIDILLPKAQCTVKICDDTGRIERQHPPVKLTQC